MSLLLSVQNKFGSTHVGHHEVIGKEENEGEKLGKKAEKESSHAADNIWYELISFY